MLFLLHTLYSTLYLDFEKIFEYLSCGLRKQKIEALSVIVRASNVLHI